MVIQLGTLLHIKRTRSGHQTTEVSNAHHHQVHAVHHYFCDSMTFEATRILMCLTFVSGPNLVQGICMFCLASRPHSYCRPGILRLVDSPSTQAKHLSIREPHLLSPPYPIPKKEIT